MAKKIRDDLKKLFEEGDVLSARAFIDLIDSLVSTKEDSRISGSLLPDVKSSFNLGSRELPWKKLFVASESITLVDTDTNTTESLSKADVAALKTIESQRKSTDGIPVKKLRSFASASTFIDLESSSSSAGDKIDIKVADTFEALSISQTRTSLGPKENVPLELTGSLKIRPANNEKHLFHGKYQFSGKHASGSAALVHDEKLVAVEISGSLIQSSSGGTVTFSTTGTKFEGGNVILEEALVSQPGVISQSMNIGTPISPSIAEYIGVGDNHRITIAPGVLVNVFPGSRFIVKPQQPNLAADSSTGDITISAVGGGDISFNIGEFGTNPQFIPVHLNVPAGNQAAWYGPIFIGRFSDQSGQILNLDEAGQGQNASLRLNEGVQIRIQAF